jgi:hypothetical protein
MPDLQTALEDDIKSWEGIQAVPHQFGGTEFQWGTVEIGHIHSGAHRGMTDIPFTRRIREALVAAQLAHIHHTLPDSGWITFQIRTPEDAEAARMLMRLSYVQKRRRQLSAEAFAAELAALPLPETVKQAAQGQIEKEE